MVQFCTLLGLMFATSRKLSMAETHWVYSITRAAAGVCVCACVRARSRERELCWYVAIILVKKRQTVLDYFSTKAFQRNCKETLSDVKHDSSCNSRIIYKFYLQFQCYFNFWF